MRPGGKLLLFSAVGLGAAIAIFVAVVVLVSWYANAPFGLANAPPQPIAFPHTVHVAEGIQCEFCHRNVTAGAAATVPAVEQCMFCHAQIHRDALERAGGTTAVDLDEIEKVRQHFADNEPINWERVYRLPDHARFVHEAHIRFLTQGEPRTVAMPVGDRQPRNLPLSVEESCTVCHGQVRDMEVVQPPSLQSLKMGTCVDCHKELNVATDCTICHK